MRNHLVWTALVAVGLVAGVAGLAMAQPGSNANASSGAAGSGGAGGHGKSLGNMSAENRTAYIAEMKEARAAALASFKENRTAAHAAWNATMHAIKESYLENKTLVIKGCRSNETKPADMGNASKEEKQAFAKCVRDGLRPLKAAARADIEEAREEFRSAMKSAREAAMGHFAAKRQDAAHRHGRDG